MSLNSTKKKKNRKYWACLLGLKTKVLELISESKQNNTDTYPIVVFDQKEVICMARKLMNWNRNKMFKDKRVLKKYCCMCVWCELDKIQIDKSL